METVEALVVGAGVVGLGIARELARAGHETVVCEKEKTAGSGISARNSGVIHAGIYYPPGSLKSRLCQRGRDLLYDFCGAQGVAHEKIGKLIVATDVAEEAELARILENARAAGVGDLEMLDGAEVQAMEPALDVRAALFSPSTSIVDPAQLVAAFERDLTGAGGLVAYGSEVATVDAAEGGFIVSFAESADETLFAKKLINCAGFGAQAVAARIRGLAGEFIPPLRMVRGTYFSLSGKAPFAHLVYPVPPKGGLGVHATLDTAGAVRFGPDVEPIECEDYRADEGRREAFEDAISRYYPGVRARTLSADYVGIRPQIGTFGAFNDFMISTEVEHGIKGLVNLFGIESPGLTSALAIAEHVAALMGD